MESDLALSGSEANYICLDDILKYTSVHYWPYCFPAVFTENKFSCLKSILIKTQ